MVTAEPTAGQQGAAPTNPATRAGRRPNAPPLPRCERCPTAPVVVELFRDTCGRGYRRAVCQLCGGFLGLVSGDADAR